MVALFKMNKGILLIAFGKPGYAYMAYNMAVSILKYSPNLKITLASDGLEKYMRSGYSQLFDNIVHFTPKEAGRVKVEMDLLSPYEHTLYLDVDGCLVSDIEPFFDELIAEGKPFNTDVHGSGGLRDNIPYAIWAKNTASWAWFDIPIDAQYQAVQSSITYFNKNAKPLFDMAREKYEFPRKYLSHKWGNSIPDELIFSGCLAKLGWSVGFKTHPIMFGNSIRQGLTRKNIGEKYHVLSLYGNQKLVRLRYREMYDHIMKSLATKEFQPYSNKQFYNHKHVA